MQPVALRFRRRARLGTLSALTALTLASCGTGAIDKITDGVPPADATGTLRGLTPSYPANSRSPPSVISAWKATRKPVARIAAHLRRPRPDGQRRHRRLHCSHGGSVSNTGDDEATLRGWFDALTDGGDIHIPLERQPWGELFGQCADRFGITWLVNIGPGGS